MITELKEAGLSEYEAKAYIALLKLDVTGGREVAKKSGVPPTRVYDALHSLVAFGLAHKVQDKPLIFKPAEPQVAFKRLFARKIKSFLEVEDMLISKARAIKTEPSKQPKIHENVTSVLGFEQMFEHVVELLNDTEKEFLVFSVGEEIPYPLKLAGKRAKNRDVKLRFIATKFDDSNKAVLEERKQEGYRIKHYPTTGEYTFAVFDRKIALINVRVPGSKDQRFSTFFEVPGLAKSLSEYFNQIWQKSSKV